MRYKSYAHKTSNGDIFWHRISNDELHDLSLGFANSKSQISYLKSISRTITYDNIDDYYFEDEQGHHINIFLAVPCNKCELCQRKFQKQFALRCSLEQQSHTSPAWFVTLTYSDVFLPFNGVEKRDVQLFLKRLRKVLDKNYKCKIRYACFSQYGNKTHRAHYHLLIFGMPDVSTTTIHKLILEAWRYGFVDTKIVKGSGVANYISRYMMNKSDIPVGKNKTFSLCSRRPVS